MKALSMLIALSLLGGAAAVPAAQPKPAATAKKPAAKPPQPDKPGAAKPVAAAAPANANVELDTTQITGNRELPRVLYVVPWKQADLGELSGKPAKSLLDEVLAPVDRDVFQRQNRYHDALHPDTAGTPPAAPKAEPQVER